MSDWVFCFFRGGCLKLEGVERFILKKMEFDLLFFQHFYSLCLEALYERFEPEPEVGQVILGATCGSAAQPFLAGFAYISERQYAPSEGSNVSNRVVCFKTIYLFINL